MTTTTDDIDCTVDGRGGGVNNKDRDGRRGGVNDNNGRAISVGRGLIILHIGPVYIAPPPGDGAGVGSGTTALSLCAGCSVGSDTAARSLGCGGDVGPGTAARSLG